MSYTFLNLVFVVLVQAVSYFGLGFSIVLILQKLGFIQKQETVPSPLFPFEMMLIGAPIFTLVQVYMSWMKVPFSLSFFVMSVLGAITVAFSLKKNGFRFYHSLKISRNSAVLSVVILLSFFLSFTLAISRPAYTWDAVAFWTPKAVALWNDGVVTTSALKNSNHPEYPLFVPMITVNSFILSGVPDEFSAKGMQTLLVYSVLLVVFVGMSQKHSSRKSFVHIALGLMILLASFVFRDHVGGEYAGTADVFVGAYVLLGGYFLLEKRYSYAALVWSIVPWMKSEGQVWALSSYVLLFLVVPRVRTWLFFLGSTLVLPWPGMVKYQGYNASQYFQFSQIYNRNWVEYAVYSLHSFREEFRYFSRWGLMFYWFGYSVIRNIENVLKNKEVLILFVSMMIQVGMYVIIFTITPEEQASFITAAIARLTLHVAPLSVLIAVKLWMEEHEKNKAK